MDDDDDLDVDQDSSSLSTTTPGCRLAEHCGEPSVAAAETQQIEKDRMPATKSGLPVVAQTGTRTMVCAPSNKAVVAVLEHYFDVIHRRWNVGAGSADKERSQQQQQQQQQQQRCTPVCRVCEAAAGMMAAKARAQLVAAHPVVALTGMDVLLRCQSPQHHQHQVRFGTPVTSTVEEVYVHGFVGQVCAKLRSLKTQAVTCVDAALGRAPCTCGASALELLAATTAVAADGYGETDPALPRDTLLERVIRTVLVRVHQIKQAVQRRAPNFFRSTAVSRAFDDLDLIARRRLWEGASLSVMDTSTAVRAFQVACTDLQDALVTAGCSGTGASNTEHWLANELVVNADMIFATLSVVGG